MLERNRFQLSKGGARIRNLSQREFLESLGQGTTHTSDVLEPTTSRPIPKPLVKPHALDEDEQNWA